MNEQEKWLDAQVLLAGCGSDAAILERVKRALGAHVPAELERARESWRARDAASLREAAHRLLGMLAAASTRVGRVASELENEAAMGRLDDAGTLLERLVPMALTLLSEVERSSIDRLIELSREPPRGGRTRD